MSTYTQKLDTVKDLLNCGLSQTEIVKKMYQAWNCKEHKTIEFIQTVNAGYPEAGQGQGGAGFLDKEIVLTCAPELKVNSNYSVSASWCWIYSDSAHYIGNEMAPPINFTHLWVTRDTNENTNRA